MPTPHLGGPGDATKSLVPYLACRGL